jgi:hypothetical protein
MKMGKYHKIEKMLDEELDKISAQGKLGTSSLEVGDKVAHFLKSIKTIEAMEEADEGSSYDYPMMMDGGRSYNYDGMSYARGDGRGRGSNARRDSRGRYSSRGGYSREGGYSGDKNELMMELEELKSKINEMED